MDLLDLAELQVSLVPLDLLELLDPAGLLVCPDLLDHQVLQV